MSEWQLSRRQKDAERYTTYVWIGCACLSFTGVRLSKEVQIYGLLHSASLIYPSCDSMLIYFQYTTLRNSFRVRRCVYWGQSVIYTKYFRYSKIKQLMSIKNITFRTSEMISFKLIEKNHKYQFSTVKFNFPMLGKTERMCVIEEH